MSCPFKTELLTMPGGIPTISQKEYSPYIVQQAKPNCQNAKLPQKLLAFSRVSPHKSQQIWGQVLVCACYICLKFYKSSKNESSLYLDFLGAGGAGGWGGMGTSGGCGTLSPPRLDPGGGAGT